MAGSLAAPLEVPYYHRLMQQADRLVRYFTEMSKEVTHVSEELEQLSMEIGAMLRECRK